MSDPDLSAINALIVDDERDMRHIIRTVLQNFGIREVCEAHDVKSALHIYRSSVRPVDLILCDWNMPGQCGIELLKELTYDGTIPPFLIISGRSDHDSVMMAKEAGVSGYIRKPFTPEQVESRILQALQRRNAAKAL